jgi:D-psicose/D-tagatose/L-ribulose 3-epimerase
MALHNIGYQGMCVMEPFVMTGGGIGHDIKVWRELETDTAEQSLDADIKRSLEFTRYMFEK